ncbi:Glycosyl transferase family 8 [Carpediemonas membranifera]|uniref:Glycosyl transferase family 8 n=1 Tax=Carpediemonas membranifera TaxID=201153 RepID=A0A8J6B323_9EUKA|nr:Glycosyl transferase family 8 [Carpediemonas membranifera]|eukprot:KAG9393229.1 Glycosyl transferase family 8 [Carpediemonas membranifera]
MRLLNLLLACTVLLHVACGKEAYATVVSGSGFSDPARVLHASVRRIDKARDFVVFITHDVPAAEQKRMTDDGMILRPVDLLPNPYVSQDDPRARMKSIVFTKLYCWDMPDYDRVVYIDSDAIIRDSVEPLFACPHHFCAIPDCCPFDYLNAGVFSLVPSAEVFADIVDALQTNRIPDSWDGADQGFFYSYFDWANAAPSQRLSIRYNGLAKQLYRMGSFVTEPWALLHYAGSDKPWDWKSMAVMDLGKFWWDVAADVSGMTPVFKLTVLWLGVVIIAVVDAVAIFLGTRLFLRNSGISIAAYSQRLSFALTTALGRPSAFVVLVIFLVPVGIAWMSAFTFIPLFTPPGQAWTLTHCIVAAVGVAPAFLVLVFGRVIANPAALSPGRVTSTQVAILGAILALLLVIPALGQYSAWRQVYSESATIGAMGQHVSTLATAMIVAWTTEAALFFAARMPKRGGVKRKQPLLDQRKAKELDVIAKAHMYREQRKEVAAEVNDGVANLNEQFVELNKMLHTTGGLQGLLEADEYENGGKSLFGETLNMFEDDESEDEPEPVAAAPVDSYEARFTALLDEYKALFAAGDAPVRSAVADLLERLTACLDEDKAAGTDVLTSIATEATATREAPSTADAALLALGVRLCPHNAAAIAGAAWALSRAVAKLPSKRAPSGGAWTTVRLLLAGLTGAAVGTSVLIPELATALVVLLARSALADDQRAMLTAALDRVVTVYSAGKPANAGTRFDPTRDVAEFRHLSETEVALRTPVPALPVLVAGAGPAVQQAVEQVASTRTPLQWQKAMRGEAVVAMAPTIDQTFGSKAEMDNRTLKKHLRKQEKRVGRQLRQEVVGAALAKEEFQQRRAKLADARWGKAQAAMDADIANSKKMVNLKKKLGLGKKG